jgi:PAS domain S-box-containing protein
VKIKNQFITSMFIFSAVFIIIAVSFVSTTQQVEQINSQVEIARKIERGTSELNYLSTDFFLYQENQQLYRWKSKFSSVHDEMAKLNSTSPEQQTLVNNVEADLQRLNAVFTDIAAFLEEAPRNYSIIIDPAFQISWSRMAVQHQGLAFDVATLSQFFHQQADQAQQTNLLLIFVLVGAFGAYFLTIYLIIYRRALSSMSKLQTGIRIIGSGNLDHSVETEKEDEIGELAHCFNQMTANLKAVTASKTELEKEIVERKKAEEALRKQATLIDLTPDAIMVLTSDGTITFWSRGAEKLYGWTKTEALGKSVHTLLKSKFPQQLEKVTSQLKRTGTWSGEIAHQTKDGREVFVQSRWLATIGSNGEVTEILESNEDVTERKRLQEDLEDSAAHLEEYASQMEQLADERAKKLKDSERLTAIGATAGMVGHDIRNPLQAIIGDLFLAKGDVNSLPKNDIKESLQESLAAIEKNSEYINKIVADLQDFARPLNPNVEETNLNSIINDLLAKNGIPDNIKLKVKIAKEIQTLTTDPVFMTRILGNLITNAVQAMPNGGNLTINVTAKADDVIIAVQDTGVGIPEEAKPRLFTPLFTTKSKGQGFGLAVVKRMTEAQSGTVTFESQQGKGTNFTITLPKKSKPKPQADF